VLWCHSPTQTHSAATVSSWDQFLQIVEAESGPLAALEAGHAVY
jgi:hypothetical protein